MSRSKKIYGIALSLFNPGKIINLSHGEVASPKTYDAVSRQPVIGGLFCPRIFGPAEAGKCYCGRLKGNRHKGEICGKCGVEVNDPVARKKRLGHITLSFPVVHPLFKSFVAVLLEMSRRKLESIIQCKNYVVIRIGSSPFGRGDIITFEEYLKNKDLKGFRAETGGKAVKSMLQQVDIESLAVELRGKLPSMKAAVRLKLARDFLKSGNRPEWMTLDVLTVLPAGLRPIVFMDDGTIASSDINTLYLKVIRRNNRLKKYTYINAPEIIINNERRLLQASVDSLFDNTKGQVLKDRSNKRPLVSLSGMLMSKHGRLRKNLLGKRVDYSGRSVIVAGPELGLDECGIPKEMAIDMFRPFIYGKLLRTGMAGSLKHARALVDSRNAEALRALEKILRKKAVLVNRAPSLHRMNFQAFYPALVDGLAIRLHPLVCASFNADFDGDQMGVHIPVSYRAQLEAKTLMLSVNNILSPADGTLAALPSQDIVLGIYYLTKEENGSRGEGMVFSDKEDALAAYWHGVIEEQSKIKLRLGGKIIDTTAGRILLSEIFPSDMTFELFNRVIKKKEMSELIEMCYEKYGDEETAALLDKIKEKGFKYATLSGISICIDDMSTPEEKRDIVAAADQGVSEIERLFGRGLITREERHNMVIDLWNRAADEVAGKMISGLSAGGFNSIFMMVDSGARGSFQQIRQIAGMRGLMAKPSGDIVELPVKSNFRDGLSGFEFLLSTHGARKGRVDGALRTASAGYFTRRLVDAAGNVYISEYDCGTSNDINLSPLCEHDIIVMPLKDRLYGRVAAKDVIDPLNGEIIVKRNETLSENALRKIMEAGVSSVKVRSPVTCGLQDNGICSMCYGFDLSKRRPARIGDAVGIIAAQSIGEPGTQLTLRTFHSGGEASGFKLRASIDAPAKGTLKFNGVKAVRRIDGKQVVIDRRGTLSLITDKGAKGIGAVPYGAVLNVEDGAGAVEGQKLAEWDPFNTPVITAGSGKVIYSDIVEGLTMREEKNSNTGAPIKKITALFKDMTPAITVSGNAYPLPIGAIIVANDGEIVSAGEVIAKMPRQAAKNFDITSGLQRVLQIFEARPLRSSAIMAEISGEAEVRPPRGKHAPVGIKGEDGVFRYCTIPANRQLNVFNGDYVKAGDILVDGVIDARDVLRILGPNKAAEHIVDEVQKVYRAQGVNINDKHIEIIVRKMLGMVEITEPGDTDFVHGEIVNKTVFLKQNESTPGKKAAAGPLLMGITSVAMKSESWLSAASFQRTTSVLAYAAIQKKADTLTGPKENIIIGNIIPLGTGNPECGEEYLRGGRFDRDRR